MKSNLALDADSEEPEYDEKWLKTNTVIIAKNGLCLLKDGRTAILKDGKIVFRGHWEHEGMGKQKSPGNRT